MKFEKLPISKARPVIKYVAVCPKCYEELDEILDETDFVNGAKTMTHDCGSCFDAVLGDGNYIIVSTCED